LALSSRIREGKLANGSDETVRTQAQADFRWTFQRGAGERGRKIAMIIFPAKVPAIVGDFDQGRFSWHLVDKDLFTGSSHLKIRSSGFVRSAAGSLANGGRQPTGCFAEGGGISDGFDLVRLW
jgi:hypothetical protein